MHGKQNEDTHLINNLNEAYKGLAKVIDKCHRTINHMDEVLNGKGPLVKHGPPRARGGDLG